MRKIILSMMAVVFFWSARAWPGCAPSAKRLLHPAGW